MKQKELASWNKAEKKIIKTIMENTDDANTALMNNQLVIRKNLTPSIAKFFAMIHIASAGRSGSSLLDFFDVMKPDTTWKRGYTTFPQEPGAVIRFNVDDLVQCIRKQEEMKKPESLILFYDVKVEDIGVTGSNEIRTSANWDVPELDMLLSATLYCVRFMAIEQESVYTVDNTPIMKKGEKPTTRIKSDKAWHPHYVSRGGIPRRIAFYDGPLVSLADYRKMYDTCDALLKNKV